MDESWDSINLSKHIINQRPGSTETERRNAIMILNNTFTEESLPYTIPENLGEVKRAKSRGIAKKPLWSMTEEKKPKRVSNLKSQITASSFNFGVIEPPPIVKFKGTDRAST